VAAGETTITHSIPPGSGIRTTTPPKHRKRRGPIKGGGKPSAILGKKAASLKEIRREENVFGKFGVKRSRIPSF